MPMIRGSNFQHWDFQEDSPGFNKTFVEKPFIEDEQCAAIKLPLGQKAEGIYAWQLHVQ